MVILTIYPELIIVSFCVERFEGDSLIAAVVDLDGTKLVVAIT
jgi:hypothetical protein